MGDCSIGGVTSSAKPAIAGMNVPIMICSGDDHNYESWRYAP